MAIDVGTAAIDRAGDAGPDTFIVKENPANATGVIDHVETWVYSGSGEFDVAAFEEVSDNTFTTRGYVEGLGATTGFNEWDAPGDFTAFDINEGDYIGMFMWMDTVQDPSGVGRWYTGFADNIPCANQGFAWAGSCTISLYATGTEAVEGYTIVIGSGAFVEAGQIVGVLHDKKIWVGEHWG